MYVQPQTLYKRRHTVQALTCSWPQRTKQLIVDNATFFMGKFSVATYRGPLQS